MKLSAHFGLNVVNADAYGGWSGYLVNCVNDAALTNAAAAPLGFSGGSKFDSQATRLNLFETIAQAAQQLDAGDTFFFSYSGHGSQVHGPEPDLKNETLCLFDGEVTDDALVQMLATFRAGVRVIIDLDCCFAGGMDRKITRPRLRGMPLSFRAMENRPRARGLQSHDVRASVIFLCACRETETASDGSGGNGAWTAALLKAIENARLGKAIPTWAQLFEVASVLCTHDYPEQHPVSKGLGPDLLWHEKIA